MSRIVTEKIEPQGSDKFSCLFKESSNLIKKTMEQLFRKIINYYILMKIICQCEEDYNNLFYTSS